MFFFSISYFTVLSWFAVVILNVLRVGGKELRLVGKITFYDYSLSTSKLFLMGRDTLMWPQGWWMYQFSQACGGKKWWGR